MTYLADYDNLLKSANQVSTQSINEANSDKIVKDSSVTYEQTTLKTLVAEQEFKSSNFKTGVSGWRVTGTGDAEFSNVVVRGVVYATSGTIGGITINSNNLQSSNFSSGPLGQGFRILSTGEAEFQNIIARGKITTSVFEKGTVSSVGGYVVIANSDVLASDMTALDNSTLTTTSVTFPNNEIIRLNDGTNDEWISVVSSTGFVHTITRDLAGTYSSNNNPVWKKGTAVVSMGAVNKGVIELNASSTNSPKISVKTRTSTTYNDLDDKVIIGNLKDKTGVEEYGLWIKSGAAYIGGYRLYEAVVSTDGMGDYSSIEAAISAGKKRIFVRAGSYALSSDIDITLDDVSITGENRELVIITGLYNINITGNNCVLSNFTKVINDAESGGGSEITIGGDNCVLDGVIIECNNADALLLATVSTADNTVVKNCKILYSATSGNPIDLAGTNGKFTDNYIMSSSDNYAIEISGSKQMFSRNTIILDSSTSSTGGGIFCDTATDLFCVDNYISDNSIAETTYPMLINLYSGNTNCKVANNTLVGGCTGIYVESSSDAVISGNYLDDQGNNALYISGDNTDGSGHNIISSNHIKNPTSNGIYLYYTRKTIINGNNIHGAGIYGIDGTDMNIYSVSIVNNYIKNCSSNGISVGSTSPAYSFREGVISNNITDENTGYGIFAVAEDCVIVGNLAKNNTAGQYSISATSCQYSLNE